VVLYLTLGKGSGGIFSGFGFYELLAVFNDVMAGVSIVLLLLGVAATTGQLFMTAGYKYLPVRQGSILGMLEPTFNFFVGVILFAEPFSAYSLLGVVLIIGSCLLVLAQRKE
jgi:drug/metabolite transporter (DMT)-like permease